MDIGVWTNWAVAAVNLPRALIEALAQIPGLLALGLLINNWMHHFLISTELSFTSEDLNIFSPNLWEQNKVGAFTKVSYFSDFAIF